MSLISSTFPFSSNCNIAPLQQKDYEEYEQKLRSINEISKFNSHCHLGGEIPFSVLEKYASKEELEKLKNCLEEISRTQDYKKAFGIFRVIGEVINTHEKLLVATYETCERMKKDNNQLVLLRTGLKILEKKSYEDYLKTVLEGIDKATDEKFSVFLLLSLKRSSTIEMAKETIALALKYKERGVVGIDISDKSTEGDIKTFLNDLTTAKAQGLKIAVHMGEDENETDQMLILETLKPDLIDHGVILCEEAKEWIKKNQIPVTICPTSSIATKMHDPNVSHPWIEEHLRSQHPIHFGTDDSTVFGNITLSHELVNSNLDIERIVDIAKTSFENGKKWFNNLKN